MKHLYLLLTLAALVLVSCDKKPTGGLSARPQERINKAKEMLTAHVPVLPSALLEAWYVQESSKSYYALTVPPVDLKRWKAFLEPLRPGASREPAKPKAGYDWWPDEATLARCETFSQTKLTGQTNGWLCLDAQESKIYIFSHP